MAGALKPCVRFRAAFAQRRDRALDLRLTFADAGIDILLVSEVKGDCPIYLLKAQRREVLASGFRRVSLLKGVHDGVRGHTRAGDVESPFRCSMYSPRSMCPASKPRAKVVGGLDETWIQNRILYRPILPNSPPTQPSRQTQNQLNTGRRGNERRPRWPFTFFKIGFTARGA